MMPNRFSSSEERPGEAASEWHVFPVVDLLAYHFSWVFLLIPLVFTRDRHFGDYLTLWAVGMTFAYLHRHWTLVYVYLDREVFQQYRTRATLFVGYMALGFVGSAWLWRWKSTSAFFHIVDLAFAVAATVFVAQTFVADKRGHRYSVRALVAALIPFITLVSLSQTGVLVAYHTATMLVLLGLLASAAAIAAYESPRERPFANTVLLIAAVGGLSVLSSTVPFAHSPVLGKSVVALVGLISATWGVWHVLMQKFGMLRMYAAKSRVPIDERPPPWVDRLLVFGPFPLLATWIGTAQRTLILRPRTSITQYLVPIIDVLECARPVLLPFGVALAVFSIAIFVYYEICAGVRRSTARTTMGISLVMLHATFFVCPPMKVYLAYNFSHAIEYMVFVWAFLRRRHQGSPVDEKRYIVQAVRRPWAWWGTFSLAVGGSYFFLSFGDDFGWHAGQIEWFGAPSSTWILSLAIWQSFVHFYFDGFLWKIRKPTVRAAL